MANAVLQPRPLIMMKTSAIHATNKLMVITLTTIWISVIGDACPAAILG
jgi:hypothetical protein